MAILGILQENHYYPFGMNMEGPWAEPITLDRDGEEVTDSEQLNDYQYNGKELDTDLGLNWYHYGARMYDAAIGRFTGVDPISDKFPSLSTYNYASNSPIANIDLHGLQAVSVTGGAWLAERKKPEKAKGLYQKARNYEIASGAGTLVGAAAFTAVAYPAATLALAKDEALSYVTNGISDVLSFAGLAKNVFKRGGRKLGGAYEDLMSLSDDGFRTGANSIEAGIKSIDDVEITSSGIKGVESHLSQGIFTDGTGVINKGNQIMIDRLKKIAEGKLEATDADLYFYSHELRERELMGGVYNEASYFRSHSQAAKEYGVKAVNEETTFYTSEARRALWE